MMKINSLFPARGTNGIFVLNPEGKEVIMTVINKKNSMTVIGLLCLYAVLGAAACSGQKKMNQAEMFELIISRIQEDNSANIRADLDSAIASSLKFWTTDGAFSDVDYADTSRTGWRPMWHISRLYDFALAYVTPSSAYYESDELFNKITVGLEYWFERNPDSDNWWQNQIGEPQRLGLLLIQMRKGARRIPADLENKTLERMKTDGGDPALWTGANKTDIALHWFYRACLTEDAQLLAQAVAQAYEPVVLTSDEGIQHDYSYFQHDRQLYVYGYGNEFVKGVTLFALYTVGTPFALSGEKLGILRRFVLETFSALTRGQYAPFSVMGRGLSRRGATGAGYTAALTARMETLDPEYAAAYREAVQRMRGEQPPDYGIKPVHRYYPAAEYTFHSRPDYAFDVRLNSVRTGRIEYGNEENLKTYYASDGSTNILLRGDEYKEIFAVWDWTRVPGITGPRPAEIPLPPKSWCVYGTAEFAGGVSDALYGVTAYSYGQEYTGVGANKAWFFFDDEIVCLGSGLSAAGAAAGLDVNTTINQCLLAGDVRVSFNGEEAALLRGEHDFPAAPDWALHDGAGYLFPQGGAVRISNAARRGSWRDINITGQEEVGEKEVFTLWLDHGKDPAGASYAYTVVPGKSTGAEMEEYRKSAAVEICANTAEAQAVYHAGLDILGIVFYQPAVFEGAGMRVQVDRACAILFRDTKAAKPVMYIADPAQTRSKITARVGFSGGAAKDIICDFTGKSDLAGASKQYALKR
jgi:chondroitin AC lyase